MEVSGTNTDFTDYSLLADVIRLFTSDPIYKTLKIEDVRLEQRPARPSGQYYVLSLPNAFKTFCSFCDHDQNWWLKRPIVAEKPLEIFLHVNQVWQHHGIQYECANCRSLRHYSLAIRLAQGHCSIVKYGQFPALERDVPASLKKFLDKQDQKFLRLALTCRNFEYGIAAVTYLRRILEDQIDKLLKLIADAARSEGGENPLLAEVEKVKAGVSFQAKLALAVGLLPKRLHQHGSNPIDILYSLVSEGLHTKSDEECGEIFDKCHYAITYVVSTLNEEKLHDAEFQARMKALQERKPGRK